MNISLLLPTRGRPVLVRRLFDSLLHTTSDLQNLEVILYLDADDRESQAVSCSSLSLLKIVGNSGQSMGYMNRACYGVSHGRYVMLVNDDAIFRTSGWDTRVVDAFCRFTDEIALVYGNDLDQGEAVPTFPILSRRVCDVLGEVCPRGYRNLHIESHLFDIFGQLRRLGHDRIVYLEDVIFEHLHYAVGKASLDDTYKKKDQRADDLLFIALDDERAFKASLLAEHIKTLTNRYSTEGAARDGQVKPTRLSQKTGFKALLKRLSTFR